MIPTITEGRGYQVERRGAQHGAKKVSGIDLFCQRRDAQTKRICEVFLQLLPTHTDTLSVSKRGFAFIETS